MNVESAAQSGRPEAAAQADSAELSLTDAGECLCNTPPQNSREEAESTGSGALSKKRKSDAPTFAWMRRGFQSMRYKWPWSWAA